MVRTVAVFLFLFLAPAAVWAQSELTRFKYDRDESAGDCPTAEAVSRGVAARLGYEPFAASGRGVIAVAVARVGGGLRAQISVRDAEGAEIGSRVLLSDSQDCTELAASIELAIAIAIDPLHDGSAGEPTEPAPAPTEPAPTLTEPPAPAMAPASPPLSPPSSLRVERQAPDRWSSLWGLGVVFAPSSAPEPTGGLTAQFHLRRPGHLLGLEARYDVPASTSVDAGSVRAGLMLATALACLRFGAADACALGEAGLLRASGERFESNYSVVTPHAAGGGRVAASLPLADALSLQLHADVTVPLSRTTLAVDDMEVWSTPSVAAIFGSRVRWEVQ